MTDRVEDIPLPDDPPPPLPRGAWAMREEPPPPPRTPSPLPGTFTRTWQHTELGKRLRGEPSSFPDSASSSHPPPSGSQFRVVSYNVLAQDHMLHHRHHLYAGIPDRVVQWEPRYPRLLAHILALGGDVLCLQEVQHNHYEESLQPDLRARGYEGVYKRRTGDKPDGCAIFYRADKFTLVDSSSVEYKQPRCQGSLDRDNIALLATLEVRGAYEERFVVATTHLLFNPKRSDVRLAQMALLMAELDRAASIPGMEPLPIIVTGDFNCESDSREFRLIRDGVVSDVDRMLVSGRRSAGRDGLLSKELGVTDQCKHIDQLFASQEPHRLFHSETHPSPVSYTEQQLQEVQKRLPGVTLGSGEMSQSFGWKPAYNFCVRRGGKVPSVSTFHSGWVTVDHILYSRCWSERHEKIVEGRLKLISRLLLPSEKEAEGVISEVNRKKGTARVGGGGLPTEGEPSDHFPLVAEFLLAEKKKGKRRR